MTYRGYCIALNLSMPLPHFCLGSGKTLAYLIPLLNDLMSLQNKQMDAMDSPACREGGTRAIVIAPTRELCVQITEVLERLTKVSNAI